MLTYIHTQTDSLTHLEESIEEEPLIQPLFKINQLRQ